MDGKVEDKRSEQLRFLSAGSCEGGGGARSPGARPGPTWRAWILSIVAAVVLSAAASLLLGGSFRLPAAGLSPGGCGATGNCCPPPDPGK